MLGTHRKLLTTVYNLEKRLIIKIIRVEVQLCCILPWSTYIVRHINS